MTGRVQTRIDPNLQEEAENILRVQGITPSQAIVMFYTQITRQRWLPFQPSEVPNIELSIDLENAKSWEWIKTYNNKKDLFDSLNDL